MASPSRIKTESVYTLDVAAVGASKDLTGEVQIVATTDIPTFSRQKYSITRTHAELERLTSYIQSHFPNLIPPIPPSKSLEVSIYVKSVDLFLKRIVENAVLKESDGVRLFFDSEFQFTPPPPPPSRQKSVFSLFSSAVAKVTETDPFFDDAKTEATGIESTMAAVSKVSEKAGKIERAYATACIDVCSRFLNLADEEPEPVSSSLKKMGKYFQLLESAYGSQSAYSTAIFAQYCDSHSRSAQAAITTLNNRLDVVSAYETACLKTSKKLQAIEKLKASSNIRHDKADAAMEDLHEAKRTEETTRELYRKMGESVKLEYQIYAKRHNDDLNHHLDEFVAKQLHYNSQILAVLNDRI